MSQTPYFVENGPTYANGQVSFRKHYDANGKLHDGPNGEPAEAGFNEDGSLSYEFCFIHGQHSDGLSSRMWWPDGTPRMTSRYLNGLTHNGPNGEPAIEQWDTKGRRSLASYRIAGQVNNSPNGEPTHREWYSNGKLKLAVRAVNGKRTDGPSGEPAVATWHRSGKRASEDHYLNGKRTDGPNGEPSQKKWIKG